jgi:D-alanine--poly(phosphoribitol) ligase subunit 2
MDRPDMICQFLLRELIKDDELELALDEPIFSGGLLDSFAVIQLMRYLQDELGAIIPVHEVTLADFDTVQKIVELVSRHARAK